MKKIISLMLALTLLSLAACGGNSPTEAGAGSQTENTASEAQKPAEAGTDQKTAGADTVPASENAGADQKPAEAGAEGSQAPAENSPEAAAPEEPAEEVILDNDFYRLTYKGLEEDDAPYFCKLILGVESKGSEDMLLSFGEFFALAINGYGISSSSYDLEFDYAVTDPDKGPEFAIRLYNCVPEAIGVDSVDKIEKVDVILSGWEQADGKYTRNTYGECSIYPTGAEGSYVQKERESMIGDESAETDDFKVTLYWKEGLDFISAHETDGLHNPVVIIENRTDEEYNFSVWDFKINGVQNELKINSGSVGGDIKPGGTLVGLLDASGTVRAAKEKGIAKADSISFEFDIRAVSDHPYDPGDLLAKFPVTVAPEDIHK